MGLPEFLRKTGTSMEEKAKEAYHVDLPDIPGTESYENHTVVNRKNKFSAKCMFRCGVILLLIAGISVGVTALVLKGAERSVGCGSGIHANIHKGKVVPLERGPQNMKIQCDDGYKLIGSPIVHCLPSGHWNETPTCVAKECKHLPVPDHSAVKLSHVASSIMKEFEVSCHEGYVLWGNQTVVCQSDETWSSVPVCKPVDCGDPPDIENGKIDNLNETTYNSTFLVDCNDGYYLENGNETVKCESNGEWDESPECAPVSCGMPGKPNHASMVKMEGIVLQKSVEFKCLEGFEMKGNPKITCRSNGMWSMFPICDRVNCGHPSDVDNGRIMNLEGTAYQSTFVVECNYGYVLKGNKRVECESSGRWREMPVCEKVSCGSPPVPNHAYIQAHGGTFFGDSVTYECRTRYRLDGNSQATCQGNGKWTMQPTCDYIPNPCYSNPCYHGYCEATGSSYRCISSHVSGNSASGYSGVFCETIFRKFRLLSLALLIAQFLIKL